MAIHAIKRTRPLPTVEDHEARVEALDNYIEENHCGAPKCPCMEPFQAELDWLEANPPKYKEKAGFKAHMH